MGGGQQIDFNNIDASKHGAVIGSAMQMMQENEGQQ